MSEARSVTAKTNLRAQQNQTTIVPVVDPGRLTKFNFPTDVIFLTGREQNRPRGIRNLGSLVKDHSPFLNKDLLSNATTAKKRL